MVHTGLGHERAVVTGRRKKTEITNIAEIA